MHVACGRGLMLFWRRYEMLCTCTSSFVDDVMFYTMGPLGQSQSRCYVRKKFERQMSVPVVRQTGTATAFGPSSSECGTGDEI